MARVAHENDHGASDTEPLNFISMWPYRKENVMGPLERAIARQAALACDGIEYTVTAQYPSGFNCSFATDLATGPDCVPTGVTL